MRKLYSFLALSLCLGFSSLSAQGSCSFDNVTVEPHLCIDGMFLVDIDFDITDPEGNVFGIVGNATNYGFFSYDSLPVTLGPLAGDGVTEWEFILYDLGEPNCQTTYDLGIVDCCSITDVVVDQVTCTGLDAFRARINFQHSNTGSSFDVYNEDGVLINSFPYTALPVTVNGLPSEGIRTTHITLCDSDSPNCCTEVNFQDPDCNPNDCEIYNVIVVPGDCATGQFSIVLDFDTENQGSAFTVSGNGTNYGTFGYGDLPLILGPLDGDGETVYEFLIRDMSDMGCTGLGTVGPIACPPTCGFLNMSAQPLLCQTDTSYQLRVNFTPIAVGDAGFSVYGGGAVVGSYSYADLPVVVQNFPGSGDFFDEVVICDNADPTCCDTLEFQALACQGCLIYNLTADPTVCDENDQFWVTIDFDYWNVSNDGFQLGGNGTVYGQFAYDEVPVTLGPFTGDSSTYYEFVVLDLGGGFCLAGTEMGIVDCDCGFEEIAVTPLECSGNGTFDLLLDFLPIDVMNTHFDVLVDDQAIGYFAYADLPIVVQNFPQSENGENSITICDNDNPTCCATYTFTGPDCTCTVHDLVATALECDTMTSTFGMVVDFIYEGDSVQTFTVYLGDEEVGVVEGLSLPDTVYGLTSPGGTEIVRVCANEISDCCTESVMEAPQCGEEPCGIFNLSVSVSDCNPQTQTFGLTIDFDWTGEVALFDIFLDGKSIGFVPGVNLPLTINGLISDGGGAVVQVCANEMPDCCATEEVQLPQCPEPCDITELSVEVLDCDELTETFGIVLGFDWTGGNGSFDLFFGGEFIGVLEGADFPDTIFGFTSLGGAEVVRLCARGTTDCCAMVEVQAPLCGEEPCTITEFTADVQPCDEITETFSVIIDFDYTGESDFFDVFLGGEQVGFIGGQGLPATITGLTSEGGIEELRVCANDDPECCAAIDITAPQCGEEPCSLSGLTAETTPCDSASQTFSLVVNFDWTGESDNFDVFLNGIELGQISGNALPHTFDGLEALGGNVPLQVCAHDRDDCCTSTTVQLPVCGQECDITELNVVTGQCTSDSTFGIAVTYDYTGFANDFVEIWVDTFYLGIFPAADQPIALNSVPSTVGDNITLRLCEIGNDGCCAETTFPVPACNTCDITALIVEVNGECNADSMTFPVFLNVTWSGYLNGFDIYAGDEFLLFIEPSQLPYTIPAFPLPDAGQPAVINVCAHDNNDCCAMTEFEAPECVADSCRIFDMTVDVGVCTSDTTFGVWIDFEREGVVGPIAVWANGVSLGTYPLILPMFVGSVPGNAGDVELRICQDGNDNCCATKTIEGMSCGECSINDLQVSASPCDTGGFFYAILSFNYVNVGGTFTVAGNGTQYGTFTYDELPLSLGPLNGDGVIQWEFVVQDLENPGCLDFADLGAVDCESVGVLNAAKVRELDVRYGDAGGYVVLPEKATNLSVWTYDGKLLLSTDNFNNTSEFRLTDVLSVPGLYIMQVATEYGLYVGKVVGME